jgi:NAD(P)-dependent dehydrogenase (short-subunit alcohol dehydrogenase family)
MGSPRRVVITAGAAGNEAITASVCDVSDRSSVERFVTEAADTASVEEMDPDQWEAVLAVNLTGTFNLTRLAIPHLKRADRRRA